MKQKSAIILLETIFALVLFSIVSLYSINILITLFEKNRTTHNELKYILQLESTKYFIQKNSLDDISFTNNTLYFKSDILLKNVFAFHINQHTDFTVIDISLHNDQIVQKWVINNHQ